MFEVEYLWNCRVKKEGVKANQMYYDFANFRHTHWFYLQSLFKSKKGPKCFTNQVPGQFWLKNQNVFKK